MSTSRPKTSIGFQLHARDDANKRHASFDPVTLQRIPYGRLQNPVSGLPYTTVRRLKQQFDSGAKIVSGLRRVLEYKLGGELPDQEVAGVVDWLLSEAVSLLIVNLLMFSRIHAHSHNLPTKTCRYCILPVTVAI